jgi:hypothetical protein
MQQCAMASSHKPVKRRPTAPPLHWKCGSTPLHWKFCNIVPPNDDYAGALAQDGILEAWGQGGLETP